MLNEMYMVNVNSQVCLGSRSGCVVKIMYFGCVN